MRFRTIKLINNEDIVCNLVMSKEDLRGSFLRKGKLRDADTGKECIVVSYPVRVINQYNLNTGQISSHLMKWIPQSESTVYLIPIDLVLNISLPSPETMVGYEKFFEVAVQEQEAAAAPQKQENPNIKFVVAHPIVQ